MNTKIDEIIFKIQELGFHPRVETTNGLISKIEIRRDGLCNEIYYSPITLRNIVMHGDEAYYRYVRRTVIDMIQCFLYDYL